MKKTKKNYYFHKKISMGHHGLGLKSPWVHGGYVTANVSFFCGLYQCSLLKQINAFIKVICAFQLTHFYKLMHS